MMVNTKVIVCLSLFLFTHQLKCDDLPSVNLGLNNILDGGPKRPHPGYYWEEYLEYYNVNKFTNENGNNAYFDKLPHYKTWVLSSDFLYQAYNARIMNGRPGAIISIPLVLSSSVKPCGTTLSSSGSGFGNLRLGAFIQWDTVFYHERPIFAHRFEVDLYFPVGKNNPQKKINPGDKFFYFEPYWAATAYLTPNWAVSWRIYYLWCTPDKKNNIRTGDAIHFNYSTEYEVIPKLWLAVNGYFLQQLQDNQCSGLNIENSRTRIFSVGPGICYFVSPHFIVLSNLYFEMKNINASQGIKGIFRFIKHF